MVENTSICLIYLYIRSDQFIVTQLYSLLSKHLLSYITGCFSVSHPLVRISTAVELPHAFAAPTMLAGARVHTVILLMRATRQLKRHWKRNKSSEAARNWRAKRETRRGEEQRGTGERGRKARGMWDKAENEKMRQQGGRENDKDWGMERNTAADERTNEEEPRRSAERKRKRCRCADFSSTTFWKERNKGCKEEIRVSWLGSPLPKKAGPVFSILLALQRLIFMS